jgi:hypothetical protein
MDRRWLEIGTICVTACVLLVTRAEAITGPINVTALSAPCSSAIPDDWLDDRTQIQCAIDNFLPAAGGEIYIPAGNYWMGAPLVITNKNVMIRGEGQRITRLSWYTSNGNGIQFTSNTGPINHTLVVKGMSLLRATTAFGPNQGGAAITGSWRQPTFQGSWGGVSATITDLHIGTDPIGESPIDEADSNYWDYGVQLTNAVGARINAFNFHGWKMGAGVSAIQIGGKSIGVSINDGDMGRWVRGIEVKDTSEAVQIENVEGSEHYWAYMFTTTGKGHVLAHSHASFVNYRFVLVENSSEVAITDNLFFNIHGEGQAMIEIVNSPSNPGSGFRVRGNNLGSSSIATEGIILAGSISDSVISGNQTASMAHGIWLKPGVTGTLVVANRNRLSVINAILDQGSGNSVPAGDNPTI